ncbi:MAG: hypothetical protein DRJ63_10600 [Thermoprotei archaeon]|nr:MAG: hypothetical protein DRJ63_10600 [Thermoprotei archaeon]
MAASRIVIKDRVFFKEKVFTNGSRVVNSTLENSIIGPNSLIKDSTLVNCVVEPNCSISGEVLKGQIIEENYPKIDAIKYPAPLDIRVLRSRLEKEVIDLSKFFGNYSEIISERREVYLRVLDRFEEVFGSRKLFLVRVPGRVNLMGRHVDHRGGYVNPIVFNKEVVLVASPRNDDKFVVENFHSEEFPGGSFRLSEEIPKRKISSIEDWRKWTQEKYEERTRRGEEKSWINYVKTVVYLQEYYRLDDSSFVNKLRGLDMLFYGDIPMSAGLSSSSALVVATYLATVAANRLIISKRRLVELCGYGEWYVGTRGGCGDHAAMIWSKAGYVSHIGFFPLRVSYAKFPSNYRILVCNSFVEAKKMTGAKDIFNQRVACYEIGFMILKKKCPDILSKVRYLRDINTLNFDLNTIYSMVKELPLRASREELLKQLPEMREKLMRIFREHKEPPEGYYIRDVCLFGIAECERSRIVYDVLSRGDVEEFGELMKISHDGDRVVKYRDSREEEWEWSASDEYLEHLISLPDDHPNKQLFRQPGAYRCSIRETDYLVDLLLKQEGVVGAQLAGAGLGGCVIALVHEKYVKKVVEALYREYYDKCSKPRTGVLVCVPVEGASFLA